LTKQLNLINRNDFSHTQKKKINRQPSSHANVLKGVKGGNTQIPLSTNNITELVCQHA